MPGLEGSQIGELPELSIEAWKIPKVLDVVKGLDLSREALVQVRHVFESEMELGLAPTPSRQSCLQMANTFIPQLPNGTEEGKYLALDLGGTNFRTLLVEFEGGQLVREVVKFAEVPENVRLGPGPGLFDYLASFIHSFLGGLELLEEQLPLGFTFSFPMDQKSLSSGLLVAWTKTFNCPGVVGRDAVEMLNEAIRRRGDLKVEVKALLNDTTGTLIQGAYLDPTTAIGLILGTGSNACYIESLHRVPHWHAQMSKTAKEVIIDIEWGAFGDNGVLDFIRTEFDREVDHSSLLVNSFTFEKYLAGKYLGEIVRVVLMRLTSLGLLFGGKASAKLAAQDSFTSAHLSQVEEDSIKGSSERSRLILEELDLTYVEDDLAILKHVCFTVSERAAKLVSVCLASLLDRMDRPGLVTIAVDGSVFQFHPRLKQLMNTHIADHAPLRQFRLLLAEDGSGKGAGLATAIATRLQKEEA